MRAELRSVQTMDGRDFAEYRPADKDCFGIAVRLLAGPSGSDGEESFDFTLCTPRWLETQLEGAPLPGRHYLFVRRFDRAGVLRFLDEYCAGFTAGSWNEIAERLGRIGHWEYEDYRG
jgi:hypothetical protein